MRHLQIKGWCHNNQPKFQLPLQSSLPTDNDQRTQPPTLVPYYPHFTM